MKFKTAYLKLTLFYVLIVMAISVAFSVSIYNISNNELGRGFGKVYNTPSYQNTPKPFQELERLRESQINESSDRLKANLFYFNLLILVLSSLTSYFLAKKTLQPIENSMDAQNRFTSDASHELRTPLSAMKTEIEVSLRDKGLNLSDAKNILKSNLEEIDKLEKMSNALLKLSRTEEGDEKNFELVKLDEAILDAISKVEARASTKHIEINSKLVHAEMRGELDNLSELFVILLDNAVKYSPEKSEISVSMKKEIGRIAVKVRDQGIGIKAMELPHIFERFYRADQSRCKEKCEGFGLGLSIAERIVKIHKGSIRAESKIGKGTTFVIVF